MPIQPYRLMPVAARRHRVQRFGVIGCVLLTVATAVWITTHGRKGAGDVVMMVPGPQATAAVDNGAPVVGVAPQSAPALPSSGVQGNVPKQLWRAVTDDTARATRAQLALVKELEAAIREQVERLLRSAERPG